MNQVAFYRAPKRSLALCVADFGNNRKTGKYKKTVTVTKPLTYEQYLKPQHVGRLKAMIKIRKRFVQGGKIDSPIVL